MFHVEHWAETLQLHGLRGRSRPRLRSFACEAGLWRSRIIVPRGT